MASVAVECRYPQPHRALASIDTCCIMSYASRATDYRIPGNFQGRNFREFVENKIVMEKTFVDCSLLSPPKDTTPPNFAEKTFANSYKTSKFAKVFSLESFPLYSVLFHFFFLLPSATCGLSWVSTVCLCSTSTPPPEWYASPGQGDTGSRWGRRHP